MNSRPDGIWPQGKYARTPQGGRACRCGQYAGVRLPGRNGIRTNGKRKEQPRGCSKGYLISCSNASNSGVEKNSPSVIPSPSQSFLMVTIEISLRLLSSMLYTVEGVTPESVASSFGFMARSLHNCTKRFTTILQSWTPPPRRNLSAS